MASRELKDLDHVRIVDKGEYHGYNAVVIEADGMSAKVQIRKDDRAVCKWYLSSDLLIRHDPQRFIHDGRYDEAAERKHDEYVRSSQLERNIRINNLASLYSDDHDFDDGWDDYFLNLDIDDVKALHFKCERLEEENERLKQVIKTLQGVA